MCTHSCSSVMAPDSQACLLLQHAQRPASLLREPAHMVNQLDAVTQGQLHLQEGLHAQDLHMWVPGPQLDAVRLAAVLQHNGALLVHLGAET